MRNLFFILLVAIATIASSWRFSPVELRSRVSESSKQAAKIFGTVGLSVSLLTNGVLPAVADVRLNAPTAAGTRVNSDAESLLRYGLPINNKEVREIQESIESIKMNLKTRRSEFARQDIRNAEGLLNKYEDKLLKAVPSGNAKAAAAVYEKLKNDVSPLKEAINAEMGAGSGSVQERSMLDTAYFAQGVLSKDLSAFEELLVPQDFKRVIPEEYAGLPALQGRAEVEMVIKKPDGSKFDVEGKLYDKVDLTMVIDGYNAPLTGGNFVDLVNKGFYNNKKITRSDGFVVQMGDANPDGEVHGYVPSGATEERKVPLEISLKVRSRGCNLAPQWQGCIIGSVHSSQGSPPVISSISSSRDCTVLYVFQKFTLVHSFSSVCPFPFPY
jgi:peptidylprolyl isomerase